MRKLKITACLIVFIIIPCKGMIVFEQQIKNRSRFVKTSLWRTSVAATIGIGTWTSSCINKVLNNFSQEQEILSSLKKPVDDLIKATQLPVAITANYWSSLFKSIATKCFLPLSLIDTLKPFAANRGCRLTAALGIGLITGITFFKLARATNYFGLQNALYKAKGIKTDKHILKVTNAIDTQTQTHQLAAAHETIEQNNGRITTLEQQVNQRNIHIGALLSQIALQITDNDDHKELQGAQKTIAQNNYRINELQKLLTKKEEYIVILLSQLTQYIQEDTCKPQELNKIEQILTELLQERRHKEMRSEEMIVAVETMLAAIGSKCTTQQSHATEFVKPLITQAVMTRDNPLLTHLKKQGISSIDVDSATLHQLIAYPEQLYPFVADEECPICFEPFTAKNPRIRPCRHILCNTCYGKLEKKPCPFCRSDIEGKNS